MRELWENDPTFRNTLVWGLHFMDPGIKHVCAELIAAFRDERADDVLRRFLMDSSEPDELKNDLFIVMSRLGYKQPYLAYISGKLAEVRVGEMDAPSGISRSSAEMLQMIASSELCSDDPELLRGVAQTVNRYLSALDKPARMVNKKAWAAAFIYYTLLEGGYPGDITLGIICRQLGAQEISVVRCLKLISACLGEEDE